MQRVVADYKILVCINSLRNRGWYPARVHPFSGGNGKGDGQHKLRSYPFQDTVASSWRLEQLCSKQKNKCCPSDNVSFDFDGELASSHGPQWSNWWNKRTNICSERWACHKKWYADGFAKITKLDPILATTNLCTRNRYRCKRVTRPSRRSWSCPIVAPFLENHPVQALVFVGHWKVSMSSCRN